MTASAKNYPLASVRALALHAQGLTNPNSSDTPSTPDAILSMVERIGCVQIDTLQMVRRSQYVTLWSRLGNYDPSDLDALASGPDNRRLFEYWMHAACIIPFSEYRYRLPLMRRYRDGSAGWYKKWIKEPGNAELVKTVINHIRDNGPARSADFEHRQQRSDGWWDWKPAKRALEHLYNQGDLMIANRVNFQRVYDIKSNVVPDNVDTSEPSYDETALHMLELSMRALGVCEPAHLGSYVGIKRTQARPFVEQMMANGTLISVQSCLFDGKIRELVVHKEDVKLLDQAADGDIRPRRTTFLSPFDNLFWAGDRDVRFWGFRQVLEAYKPKDSRIWGYFCLPILYEDRLIGRFDPKLERRDGVLRLRSLLLEPEVSPTDEMAASVAEAMRDFMKFHNAKNLVIETTTSESFSDKIMMAL